MKPLVFHFKKSTVVIGDTTIIKENLKELSINFKKFRVKSLQRKKWLDCYETMKYLNVTPSILKELRKNGDIVFSQKSTKTKLYYETESVFMYLIHSLNFKPWQDYNRK